MAHEYATTHRMNMQVTAAVNALRMCEMTKGKGNGIKWLEMESLCNECGGVRRTDGGVVQCSNETILVV